jgi:hypothetical protein
MSSSATTSSGGYANLKTPRRLSVRNFSSIFADEPCISRATMPNSHDTNDPCIAPKTMSNSHSPPCRRWRMHPVQNHTQPTTCTPNRQHAHPTDNMHTQPTTCTPNRQHAHPTFDATTSLCFALCSFPPMIRASPKRPCPTAITLMIHASLERPCPGAASTPCRRWHMHPVTDHTQPTLTSL